MQVEIVQGGRVLRQVNHNGQAFVEAPPSGEYAIRVTNNGSGRKLAVVSVDGINVIDNTNASYDGPGYVLTSWQTVEIPGWRRDGNKVAHFEFNPQEGGSYAEQTGRGKKNTGVVGVAVFDERYVAPPPRNILLSKCSLGPSPSDTFGGGERLCSMGSPRSMDVLDTYSTTSGSLDFGEQTRGAAPAAAPAASSSDTLSVDSGPTRGADGRFSKKSRPRRKTKGILRGAAVASPAPELATAYGRETSFHTSTTSFKRATQSPSMVVELRYAVRAKLVEWGVPIPPEAPAAFPASTEPSCPAPSGWRG
jgi:hypothetical protein